MSHILGNVLFYLYCFHMVNQHHVIVSYSTGALSNNRVIFFHSVYADLFRFDK